MNKTVTINQPENFEKEFPNFKKKYSNKLSKNLIIYVNLKRSNGYKYIKKETENDSIFITTTDRCGKKNLRIGFLTKNSRNTAYTKFYNISDDLFNFYSDLIFEYNPKISYKNDGYIVIYLPNLIGHYKDYIDLNELITLIKMIRSKKKNKILLRIHHKNFKDIKRYVPIIKVMKLFNNIELDLQKYKWDDIINNCYCIFCQNTSMCFNLYALGIPIFNMQNVVNLNIYPELSINFKYFNNFEIEYNKVDRKKILSKYYSSLIILSPFKHLIDKYKIEDHIKHNDTSTTLFKFYKNNFLNN